MSDEVAALTSEDLAAEQRSSRLRLAFSPAAERAYRQHAIAGQRRSVLAHWLIGLCLCDLFFINDCLVAPHDILLYAIGRFGCMTPACLLAIAVGYRFRRAYEYAVCVPPVAMAVALSALLLMTHGAYRTNYLFGDILLMMCGSVISRTRLPFTAWTVALQCVCFATVVFGSDAVPADSVLVSMLFCTSGAVMSLLTAYALEQASRNAFLMSSRIAALNRQLEAAAMTDPLTGLANRRGLAQVTDRLWAAAAGGMPMTISFILIDVDRFKLFNDNYGHPAGDRCLVVLAGQVASVLRRTDDLAARFGGEELLVVLPGLGMPAARAIAERIRLAIADARIPHPAVGSGAVVTASLGVATATTLDCTPQELTARADSALYAAKKAGRDRVWPPLEPTDPPAAPGVDLSQLLGLPSASPNACKT